MRVLVGPGTGLPQDGAMMEVARALAGPNGLVLTLGDVGIRNLSRRLSAAEVALLRTALRATASDPEEDDGIVGYVCGGFAAVPAASAGDVPAGAVEASRGLQPVGTDIVVVEDHVNLTWRSPLTGPNDESAGPRFPSLTGIYLPELTAGRLSQHPLNKGMIVRSGVVAGVFDPARLTAFETEAVEAHAYAAVSAELVPVVIVAAHLGLQVAAATIVGRQ
jgi:Phosphorylase superfamily